MRGRVGGTREQHLRSEGCSSRVVRKAQQQLDPRGEAHLLLSPSDLHVADQEMQTQRHRFTCPRSHSKSTTRARPNYFPGLTGHLAQSWSSVNIFLDRTPSPR